MTSGWLRTGSTWRSCGCWRASWACATASRSCPRSPTGVLRGRASILLLMTCPVQPTTDKPTSQTSELNPFIKLTRSTPLPPHRQRALLLAAARAVLYTPQHEHFGIVPLEAMAAGRPVVACNSGGPTESVPDGRGGFLCDPTPAAWAEALEALLDSKAAGKMGGAARAHVADAFSRGAFGERLDAHVHALANAPRR